MLPTSCDSILGLTKPLPDTLQAKNLNLSVVLELVDSIIQVMKKKHSDEYFKDHI